MNILLIIRPENTTFVSGEHLFTFLKNFLTFLNKFLPFTLLLVPACTIRLSGLLLTNSSTSFKIVPLVPLGKFYIFTRLSFDSPCSFMPFNKESPVIIMRAFLMDFLFLFTVSLTIPLIELSMVLLSLTLTLQLLGSLS